MSILRYLTESLINESAGVTIYHGDNHGLSDVNDNYNAMFLDNSNQQEGPGIYFSNKKSTAMDYGKYVVSTIIREVNFVPSRQPLGDDVNVDDMVSVLNDLMDHSDACRESIFYLISDYVEIHAPSDIDDDRLESIANILIHDEEARNALITLGDLCEDKKVFVDSWVEHTSIYGTWNVNRDDEIWYAVLHTDTPIVKESLTKDDV